VFGSDGTFDSAKFNVDGSYISFFAPDITSLPQAAKTVAAFHKQFKGATSPFGAPNYVAAQVFAQAATRACADGQISRSELRERVAKVYIAETVYGTKFGFTAKGDQAAAKFHIFKITGGKYKTVQ
jgi:hypothetical protein